MVYLELASAALLTGASVVLAFPFGGTLESAARLRFGSELELLDIPEISMNNGRKSILDLFKFAFSWIFYMRFWRHFSRSQLWYINGGRVLLPMMLVSLFCRTKVIYHAHLSHSDGGNTAWRLERYLLRVFSKFRMIDTVVCPSVFIQTNFFAYSNAFSERLNCIVLQNCLGSSFSGLPFRNRFLLGDKKVKRVGLFGKVTHVKGQELVCETACRFPDISFYCIGGTLPGEESYVAELKSKAPSNVIFIDEVTNVAETVDSLGIQVCLVPSKFDESFGLAAIEGMACSCVTLASHRGGLAEIAKHTGMLTFYNENNYVEKLEYICGLEGHSLASLAKDQYDKTMEIYASLRFLTQATELFDSSF